MKQPPQKPSLIICLVLMLFKLVDRIIQEIFWGSYHRQPGQARSHAQKRFIVTVNELNL